MKLEIETIDVGNQNHFGYISLELLHSFLVYKMPLRKASPEFHAINFDFILPWLKLALMLPLIDIHRQCNFTLELTNGIKLLPWVYRVFVCTTISAEFKHTLLLKYDHFRKTIPINIYRRVGNRPLGHIFSMNKHISWVANEQYSGHLTDKGPCYKQSNLERAYSVRRIK